ETVVATEVVDTTQADSVDRAVNESNEAVVEAPHVGTSYEAVAIIAEPEVVSVEVPPVVDSLQAADADVIATQASAAVTSVEVVSAVEENVEGHHESIVVVSETVAESTSPNIVDFADKETIVAESNVVVDASLEKDVLPVESVAITEAVCVEVVSEPVEPVAEVETATTTTVITTTTTTTTNTVTTSDEVPTSSEKSVVVTAVTQENSNESIDTGVVAPTVIESNETVAHEPIEDISSKSRDIVVTETVVEVAETPEITSDSVVPEVVTVVTEAHPAVETREVITETVVIETVLNDTTREVNTETVVSEAVAKETSSEVNVETVETVAVVTAEAAVVETVTNETSQDVITETVVSEAVVSDTVVNETAREANTEAVVLETVSEVKAEALVSEAAATKATREVVVDEAVIESGAVADSTIVPQESSTTVITTTTTVTTVETREGESEPVVVETVTTVKEETVVEAVVEEQPAGPTIVETATEDVVVGESKSREITLDSDAPVVETSRGVNTAETTPVAPASGGGGGLVIVIVSLLVAIVAVVVVLVVLPPGDNCARNQVYIWSDLKNENATAHAVELVGTANPSANITVGYTADELEAFAKDLPGLNETVIICLESEECNNALVYKDGVVGEKAEAFAVRTQAIDAEGVVLVVDGIQVFDDEAFVNAFKSIACPAPPPPPVEEVVEETVTAPEQPVEAAAEHVVSTDEKAVEPQVDASVEQTTDAPVEQPVAATEHA
ncbi:hypothetical protein HDU79_010290, partial [Rhizoclosmatium sp. JEL0117]